MNEQNILFCSFDGCNKEVCETDKQLKSGMRFCQEHSDQINKLIEENKIPQLIGFWVKANGGAKKLAETF